MIMLSETSILCWIRYVSVILIVFFACKHVRQQANIVGRNKHTESIAKAIQVPDRPQQIQIWTIISVSFLIKNS